MRRLRDVLVSIFTQIRWRLQATLYSAIDCQESGSMQAVAPPGAIPSRQHMHMHRNGAAFRRLQGAKGKTLDIAAS